MLSFKCFYPCFPYSTLEAPAVARGRGEKGSKHPRGSSGATQTDGRGGGGGGRGGHRHGPSGEERRRRGERGGGGNMMPFRTERGEKRQMGDFLKSYENSSAREGTTFGRCVIDLWNVNFRKKGLFSVTSQKQLLYLSRSRLPKDQSPSFPLLPLSFTTNVINNDWRDPVNLPPFPSSSTFVIPFSPSFWPPLVVL